MFFQFIIHATLIALSGIIPWVWSTNPSTSPYTLQLCGGIVILYTVFKKFLGQTNHEYFANILTILAVNAITQLLIFSTGGITSPLFFLYYFLIFAFAIIYESYQSFTVAFVTVAIYSLGSHLSLESSSVASLFSLLLISPLANIFSKTLIKNLESQGKIKTIEDDLKKEETDSLLWLATEAKPSLNNIIASVTDLVIFLKSTRSEFQVPKNFLDKIKKIQTDLLVLYSSSEDLEDTIKESSDNNQD